MKQLSPLEVANAVQAVFTSVNKYQFDKHVPTFSVNNAYAGDVFNMTIFEPRGDKPPIFYHTFSPYDTISKKAPNQALVFQDGELLLNIAFASYIRQRTGVMAPLVLRALSAKDIAKTRLLFIGTGSIARQSLASVAALFPGVTSVAYMNTRGNAPGFEDAARTLGITAAPGTIDDMGIYDVIICHSSAKTPILTVEHLALIKPGAFIASFASEDFSELVSDFYDTTNATVIIDWDQTITDSPDLKDAVGRGIADPAQMIRLADLLTGAVPPPRKYTVYRSHGTPMQNLAVLQLLLRAQ